MINIVVAEDQQLILKDICNKISKCGDNINIIATAINGQDGYEKIIKFKPDIVFTDISMPILSGIDMIKKVKQENLDTKFVIISGYKDFDYAREAITTGVDEYLLKPILVDDINTILQNLKNKISMSQNDYERHIVEDLINSTVTNHPTININFNYKNYYVVIFNAGPYASFTIDYATPFCQAFDDIDLIKLSRNYIYADEKVFLVKGKSSNEAVCIFATNNTDMNSLKKFASFVIDYSESKGINMTIGISRAIKHIENIGIRSQIVRTILRKNIIFSKSNLLDCSKIDIHIHNHRFFLTDNIEKRLKIFLQNNQEDGFIYECNKLITQLSKENATQMEIEKCFKNMINKCTLDYLIRNNLSDIELKIDECISISRNYTELSSNLIIIFKELIDEYSKIHNKNNYIDDIVKVSQDYIEKHVSEDINVNDIANKFSVSPTYFSRIFKKQVGISPIVYITNIRIKNACTILENNDFTVKEVSELCGYSDQFYFSKTFKSIVGIPPSEYKLKFSKN